MEFLVLRCAECSTFCVQQRTANKKWACRMCGARQSIVTVYARSARAADCRAHVQKLSLTAATQVNQEREAAYDEAFGAHARRAHAGAPVGSAWGAFLEEEDTSGAAPPPAAAGACDEGVFVTRMQGKYPEGGISATSGKAWPRPAHAQAAAPVVGSKRPRSSAWNESAMPRDEAETEDAHEARRAVTGTAIPKTSVQTSYRVPPRSAEPTVMGGGRILPAWHAARREPNVCSMEAPAPHAQPHPLPARSVSSIDTLAPAAARAPVPTAYNRGSASLLAPPAVSAPLVGATLARTAVGVGSGVESYPPIGMRATERECERERDRADAEEGGGVRFVTSIDDDDASVAPASNRKAAPSVHPSHTTAPSLWDEFL